MLLITNLSAVCLCCKYVCQDVVSGLVHEGDARWTSYLYKGSLPDTAVSLNSNPWRYSGDVLLSFKILCWEDIYLVTTFCMLCKIKCQRVGETSSPKKHRQIKMCRWLFVVGKDCQVQHPNMCQWQLLSHRRLRNRRLSQRLSAPGREGSAALEKDANCG